MATTLSLVVIFVPVAFMTGQVGRYFYSFGITSATAIMLSMFVSFTLTPALCAWWLRPEDAHQDHAQAPSSAASTPGWTGSTAHARVVARATAPLMLGIAAVTVASAAFLYPYVGKELVPDDDQSEFSVNLRLPRGTSFERTLEYMTPIEGELREALGDQPRVDDDLDPERQRQLLGPADTARRAQAVAAGADAGGAAHAEQVPERPHQRVGRHRHFRRIDGRRRRPRRRRRRRAAAAAATG